ncbi:DUF418 domain-containing protein [Paenibacillus sp. TRM 82003]|uniref:DUF418 domain-containing protein n=1 Tax=Kineococcus sp. TRM81007 TaxID=2925831 RepID=UPI001F56206C|nr:DUF418 domain-containing protein [Kineococcus sp. TRM81007]MCI2238013.1 DUF418 domain-containing protein [Kineococcus sp. TRM81007]MCI3926027.1 DUF418 domain-containing protein [Paenibacillus sp. TRM 82003]
MTATTRSSGLDVARGLAILGTFATNVWLFTHPDGLLGTLLEPAAGGTAEALAQALPLGKSLALLSLLFGVGLELQRRSVQRRGGDWNRVHRVRALVLLCEATLHFLLVAEFDVLMGYAVAALVAGPVLLGADRRRRRFVVVLLSTHALALAALTALLATAAAGTGGGALHTPYATGSAWDLVLFRVQNLVVFRAEPVGLLLLTTASFLLGAGLVRAGLLEREGGRRLRHRLIALGAVGVLAEAVLLVAGGAHAVLLTRYGSAVLVGLGLLGLVVQVQGGRDRPRWLGRRLAEVGRAALSCYVLQNVLASALCYGWGLGLAATVPDSHRAALTAGTYLVVAAAVVAVAHLLARTGRRGPLEALSTRAQRALLTPRGRVPVAARGTAPVALADRSRRAQAGHTPVSVPSSSTRPANSSESSSGS